MQAGDKIKVSTKKGTGWKSKECIYLSETDKTILVNAGNYRDTINKFDITCGKVKIQFMEDEDMNNKESRITKEQLLEECRTLGTSKEAREAIAAKYGLTEGTVQNYIYRRWPILDELNANKENQEGKFEDGQDQQSKAEEKVEDDANDEEEKNTEKIFEEIKDSQDHVVRHDNLEVLSIDMTIKGKNGVYRTGEKGIALTRDTGIMFFKNEDEIDAFVTEYKAVFREVRSKGVKL